MKLNYLTLSGVLAGSMTDPPALAFANKLANSDYPALAYANVALGGAVCITVPSRSRVSAPVMLSSNHCSCSRRSASRRRQRS